MLVLAVTTSAYAYMLGPALQFLLTGGQEGLRRLIGFVPRLAQIDRSSALWLFPIVVVSIGLAKGVAYLGQFYWMGLFGQRVAMGLRREYFKKLVSISPNQMSRFLSGDLLSRFSSDITSVETAATYAVGSYVRDGLQIIALLSVACVLDWRIAVGALAIIPIAAFPVSRLTRKFMKRIREGQRGLGTLAGQVQEGLSGIKTIQAFGGHDTELARFSGQSRDYQDALIRGAWAKGTIPGVMELLAATGIAVALSLFARVRGFDPEKVVSLLAILVLIYQPIKDLGRVGQFMYHAIVSGERLFEILDTGSTVPQRQSLPAPSIRKEIRFEKVSFRYGGERILEDLNFEIIVGQVTALVGASGSGKSTVVSLLLGFLRPESGSIYFDSTNGRQYSDDAIRDQFALVTQEPLLFSTTIYENIALGRPVGPEKVEEAARIANAHDFIRELPVAYQTLVGERGVVLSGGQKQRICLARAVLKHAPVLVLDEATSSLDPENEQEVQLALSKVLQGRTALIISHRLASVATADRICVLSSGRIIETGTHEELLEAGGQYSRLWDLQNSRPSQTGSV